MPLLSPKSLAGPGYIILNVLRGMNIIGLLAVICASLVMIVKTVTESKFFFFDAVSHVITAAVSTCLIISEASLFRSYFARNWPLLSPTHGFVALGLAMLVLGVNILGNLNKDATSQKNLGLAFWRIVIGAGILVTILGVFNIIASYVFRDPTANVTARQVRAKGAVAISTQHIHFEPSYSHPDNNKFVTTAESVRTGTTDTTANSWPVKHTYSTSQSHNDAYKPHPPPSPPKSNNTNAKSSSSPFNRLSRFNPRNILPSYHERSATDSNSRHAKRPPPPAASSYYGDDDADRRRSMQISGPIGINPQFEHLVPRFATMKADQDQGRGGVQGQPGQYGQQYGHGPVRPDSTYHPARAHQY